MDWDNYLESGSWNEQEPEQVIIGNWILVDVWYGAEDLGSVRIKGPFDTREAAIDAGLPEVKQMLPEERADSERILVSMREKLEYLLESKAKQSCILYQRAVIADQEEYIRDFDDIATAEYLVHGDHEFNGRRFYVAKMPKSEWYDV